MITNLTGWLEVNTIEESEENLWFKVIDLDIVVEQNYKFYARLFGVRDSDKLSPIANSRGLPPDSPEYLTKELEHESIVRVTWATFNEIDQPLNQLCEVEPLTGWLFLLKSGRLLVEKYGTKNVRLVVGFDNYG